jgi:hypothetical protein
MGKEARDPEVQVRCRRLRSNGVSLPRCQNRARARDMPISSGSRTGHGRTRPPVQKSSNRPLNVELPQVLGRVDGFA